MKSLRFKALENIVYLLLNKGQVREYISSVAKKEWEQKDFENYSDDLYKSSWVLEEIDIEKIKMRKDLLESSEFQKDVNLRVEKLLKLIDQKTPIPPLILRGSDYLIFDGYARTLALKQLKVKKCLAYVGYKVKL